MPKRVNSTLCFDMVSFVVLRREEGHAAQTWLKSVASHKDRLDMEFKIPESVFVHMLLSQLTRNERMNSIDMVDDPSGVIALTWEKASQAVAGLAQANHVLFSADMCSSQSLACHPFKAVMAKPSEEGKAAAKAGSALAPQAKMEVQPPQNAKNEAKMSSKNDEMSKNELRNKLHHAQNKLKAMRKKGGLARVPCKFFVKGDCNRGDECPFSHDPRHTKKHSKNWENWKNERKKVLMAARIEEAKRKAHENKSKSVIHMINEFSRSLKKRKRDAVFCDEPPHDEMTDNESD
jgi:hypothetical protein